MSSETTTTVRAGQRMIEWAPGVWVSPAESQRRATLQREERSAGRPEDFDADRPDDVAIRF